MAEKVGGIYYEVDLDTSKMVDGQRRASRELDGLSTRLTATSAAVAILAAGLAALKIAKLADEIRLLSARAEVAAGSIEAGAQAMNELIAISRRTQTSLTGNVEVFNRLNQSILQMGGNQRDTLVITELLAKAIKVSGANAVESKAAMLQFGQALGSGKLAGDELRSLLETAPYLMRQLADGIGVPVGALKQLGEEGKLTADVVTNALTKAADRIDADFQKFPQTVESAMTVAQDSAALAAAKFDELSGSSASLTGIIQGTGQVLDELAKQFDAASGEADKLGRNDAVSSWASETRNVLSYVADAADVTWQAISVLGRNVGFVFSTLGSQMGGIAAMVAAAARGEFTQAGAIWDMMKRDDAKRRAELDARDKETLRDRLLAGQRMRQAWAAQAMTPEPDRLDRAARGGRAGTLRPPTGTPATPKGGASFDSGGYLAGLEAKTLEGIARIDALEQEALRKNGELLKAGKITRAEAARAQTLIEENAASDRRDIMLREGEERRQLIEEQGKADAEARAKVAADQARGQGFAQGILTDADPVAKLQAELEAKTALLMQYAAIDQANASLYAAARVALEAETNAKIAEIVQRNRDQQAAANSATLQNYGSLFGGLADLTKTFAGEQSSAYKAIFAVSKAFAIADAIIKIQQGIAAASALPFPANIPAMASVAAATAGIVSTIKGTTFGGGRQYGGPVSADSLYRVNETGRPEMFQGSNGAQYMLPTSGGRVIPADQVGGAGGPKWQIVVNNNAPGAVASASVDQQSRVVTIAIAEVAAQIRENSGSVWSALRSATNVTGRMS